MKLHPSKTFIYFFTFFPPKGKHQSEVTVEKSFYSLLFSLNSWHLKRRGDNVSVQCDFSVLSAGLVNKCLLNTAGMKLAFTVSPSILVPSTLFRQLYLSFLIGQNCAPSQRRAEVPVGQKETMERT